MTDKLCLELWTWYACDEFRPVLQVCELSKALEFLSRTAQEQSTTIPYCPACETWSEMMLPIRDFLDKFSENLEHTVREKLERLWERCNSLDGAAFRCDDFNMFDSPQWQPIRTEAADLLQAIGWEILVEHIDELMLVSRKALYPYAFKS
jgi:hypothetical protein